MVTTQHLIQILKFGLIDSNQYFRVNEVRGIMNIEEIDRIMLSDLASIKSLILSLVAKVEHLENENRSLSGNLAKTRKTATGRRLVT